MKLIHIYFMISLLFLMFIISQIYTFDFILIYYLLFYLIYSINFLLFKYLINLCLKILKIYKIFLSYILIHLINEAFLIIFIFFFDTYNFFYIFKATLLCQHTYLKHFYLFNFDINLTIILYFLYFVAYF